jgi:uncharacterized protein (DUF1015 family)
MGMAGSAPTTSHSRANWPFKRSKTDELRTMLLHVSYHRKKIMPPKSVYFYTAPAGVLL